MERNLNRVKFISASNWVAGYFPSDKTTSVFRSSGVTDKSPLIEYKRKRNEGKLNGEIIKAHLNMRVGSKTLPTEFWIIGMAGKFTLDKFCLV